MPWYRTDDGQGSTLVCVRGSHGSPDSCRAEAFPTDNLEIGPRCARMARKLCDGPGCDIPICAKHATHVEDKDLDYCPKHKHLAEAQA